MAFFPRLVANEFAPVFRLLDDYATHAAVVSRSNGCSARPTRRTFQPRFDVRETQEGYVLHGEMPGVEQKDLDIQFTDANTLSIKGHTEQVREEGQRPSSAAVEAQPEPSKLTESDGESDSSYHKATVEDETATLESTSNAADTPAETPTEPEQTAPEQSKADNGRYWLSERTVGDFARSFKFPNRIDQDNVKASLKNGMLSILVPKAAPPVSRRINVE